MTRSMRSLVVMTGLVVAVVVAALVVNREEPSAALSTPAAPTTTAPVAAAPPAAAPPAAAPAPAPTTTRPRPTTTTTRAPATTTTRAPVTTTTAARPATTVRPVATTSPAPAPAPGNTAADALALLNRDRTANGVPALPVRADAQAKAQAWAEKLARDGTLSHSTLNEGLTQCWTGVGENVAMAPSVAQDEQILMADPPHRANIVAGKWTAVGVGVAHANGAYFVVQVFVTGC